MKNSSVCSKPSALMPQASLRSVAMRLRGTDRKDSILRANIRSGNAARVRRPVPPHPYPLPEERERQGRYLRSCKVLGFADRLPGILPLLGERVGVRGILGHPISMESGFLRRRNSTLLLGVLIAAFALAGCKSNSPSQYISPRVEGRVVDGQSHAPIPGVQVRRVTGEDSHAATGPQKGGQLMEGAPVVVTTGKDGSFILDSEHDLASLRRLGWYSVSIAFEDPAYAPFSATYTLSNAVHTATGEPVVKAGDILLAPRSR